MKKTVERRVEYKDYVRTAAGVAKYGQPINTLIVADIDIPLARARDISGGNRDAQHAVGQRSRGGAAAKQSPYALIKMGKPATPAERKALKIPPAWKDVWIETMPGASLRAMGVDAAGRTQRTYSSAHKAAASSNKFARVRKLLPLLPKLDKQAGKEMQDNDDALAVALMLRLGLRPGSTRDQKAKVPAYGATTLLREHIKITGSKVALDFGAKKGVQYKIAINDAVLAKALNARIAAAPTAQSQLLPDTNEKRSINYFKSVVGSEFVQKDLRTAQAYGVAMEAIQSLPIPKTQEQHKTQVAVVIARVASFLNNTPDVAKQSYVDPILFNSWDKAIVGAPQGRAPARKKAPARKAAGARKLTTVRKVTGTRTLKTTTANKVTVSRKSPVAPKVPTTPRKKR